MTARTAAGGDDQALTALVRLHHDRVYRFGRRVCRDGFDADDAVQQAFIQLSSRPEVAADSGVLSWIYAVVRHACLRLMRPFARPRPVLGAVDELPAPQLTPEEALERWQLVRRVHAAVAELDGLYREVLVLRDLEGLSGEETARVLGIPLAAMKSRLLRARQQLRARLTAP
jgi:RNA polymerase sigma-70 factor (ECF subfamily)